MAPEKDTGNKIKGLDTEGVSVRLDEDRPRRGYTTGACVQAASRAAALTVATGYVPCEAPDEDKVKGDKETMGSVEITLPNGEKAAFFVTMHNEGVCSVIKDAGDDPDITDGIHIFVCVSARLDGRFFLDGAEGVGRVTREGLPVAVGEAAINPVPMKHILAEVRSVLVHGADVTISIPGGEELAKRTFNPRLGIMGGLSILGTTGRIEPWSIEAFQESLIPQLDIARAAGVERPVLVPGAKGERAALAEGFDQEVIMYMGNFAGMMVAAAGERGFQSVTLLGHIAKLAKLARGDFNTHSRLSPMPLDVLADCARDAGWDRKRVRELM
ncbi:MAG TPA: cobalamin biosynthesis protein CbiD, partial [Actinobacteria bacterium]|nr:cobalamin biosynthesis protein CbiD [Actinomycetota bacterium]